MNRLSGMWENDYGESIGHRHNENPTIPLFVPVLGVLTLVLTLLVIMEVIV